MPQDAIHVTILGERTRMGIICAEYEVTRVGFLFGERFQLRSNIEPGRAVTQEGLQALTFSCNRLLEPRALVIAPRAAGYISMKRKTEVGWGIMPADRLPRSMRRGHFVQHF